MSLPHDAASSSGGLGAQAPSPTSKKAPERLGGHKHFSIDFSLELERQLELEGSSPPTTPSVSESSHSRSYPHAQPNPDTLDPHVLVHIITGLRKTVEDLTKERDDLIKLFESSTTREATLQDTLALMTEKATDYEEELSAAKKKMKEDEEAISLLRNKVEESRRGIMRLQAESRRQSAVPSALDLSRSAISGISSPPSSKRASFTPLTGRTNNHRRVSSISSGGGDGNGLGLLHLLSSDTQPISSQDPSSTPGLGPPGSRRSLFFRNSPPGPETIPLPPTNAPTSSEVEAMKKELEGLKRELADARIELSEANEAKEASDSCVKALREFIAENQVGESSSVGKKGLPPPITISGDGSDKKSAASHSGWGFKLWKADSSSNMTLSTRQPPPPPPLPLPSSSTSAPFSRLGGFFSSRASAASTIIPSSSALQTNAALTTRESFLDSSSGHSVQSISDESSLSVVEPASPSAHEEEEEHSAHVKVVDVDVDVPEVGGVGGGGDDDDGMVGKGFVDKSGDDVARIQHGVVVVV